MKTVRLSSAQHRAWRTNTPQWVSPAGLVIRSVTPEEESALFDGRQRIKKTKQSAVLPLSAKYKVGGEVVTRDFKAHFAVTHTGNTPDAFFIEVFVSGNRYMAGREVMRKQFLAAHGDCVLLGMNGKRLAFVRDPNAARPTYAESQTNIPKPAGCVCLQWHGTEPGKHHFVCEFNARAPLDERATRGRPPADTSPVAGQPLPSLQFEPPSLPGAQSASARPPPHSLPPTPDPFEDTSPTTASHREGLVEVVSPEQCPNNCRGLSDGSAGWATKGPPPGKDQHHPFCKYADAWRTSTSPDKPLVLFDLERQQVLRAATADEVAQAELQRQ